MVWLFRILIAGTLALAFGCMLGALVLIIEEIRATRRRRARIEHAIDRIARPRLTLTVEELDFINRIYHSGNTHACMKGDNDNVDNKKQD